MKGFDPKPRKSNFAGNGEALAKGIAIVSKYATEDHGVNVWGGDPDYNGFVVFVDIYNKEVIFANKDIEAMRKLGFGYIKWNDENKKDKWMNRPPTNRTSFSLISD